MDIWIFILNLKSTHRHKAKYQNILTEFNDEIYKISIEAY